MFQGVNNASFYSLKIAFTFKQKYLSHLNKVCCLFKLENLIGSRSILCFILQPPFTSACEKNRYKCAVYPKLKIKADIKFLER